MNNDNSFINRKIGNYRVIRELRSGAFGRVYLAQHTLLKNRIVAIKVLHAINPVSQQAYDDFLQEAQFLEQLKHPYILPILDVGIFEGSPYLVAEYAPNGSLRDRIKLHASQLLPMEEILAILSQVGQALDYAHQQQIIHRDMKPENILFNAKNEAMLADFGLATSLSMASIKHVDNSGTPRYMAPEQFQGNVSKESDQYGLACIAYELVSGRPPFTGKDIYIIGFQHLTEEPTPPTQLNPQLPATIEHVILKAMAKQRVNRYRGVANFISALLNATDFQTYQSTSTSMLSQPASTGKNTLTELGTTFPKEIDSVPSIADQETQETDHDYSKDYYETTRQRGQGPVTPLPAVQGFTDWDSGPAKQTSSASHLEAIPPLPTIMPQDTDRTYPVKPSQPRFGSVTSPNPGIGIHGQEGIGEGTGRVENNTLFPYVQNVQNRVVSRATATTQPNSRYRRLLLAIACLVIGAGLMAGIFLLVLPLLATHGDSNTSISSQRVGDTTPIGTTPGSIPSPSKQSTPSEKPTGLTNQGSTAQPGPSPTVAPTPITPTHTPTPTSTPASESLSVSFANPNGTQTVHSYSGSVTVTVNSAGGVGPKAWSDAFYQYVDFYGNALNPPQHTSCYVMYINFAQTDGLVSTPAYNSNHSYQFTMNAPGGTLNFSICDHSYSNNHGSLTVTITQNSSNSANTSSLPILRVGRKVENG